MSTRNSCTKAKRERVEIRTVDIRSTDFLEFWGRGGCLGEKLGAAVKGGKKGKHSLHLASAAILILSLTITQSSIK